MSTAANGISLRVLIVEDSATDCELIMREMKRDGMQVEYLRVQTEEALRTALNRSQWDVVISDFNLPTLNGFEALERVRDYDEDVPFVLVSGTVGEHVAVDALKRGANDYVMKGNLTRLPAAVRRALREAQGRREQRQAQTALMRERELLHGLMDNIPDFISFKDTELRYLRVNAALAREYCEGMTGRMVGRRASEILPPEIAENMEREEREILRTGIPLVDRVERIELPGKPVLWLARTQVPIKNEEGEIEALVAITRDVTSRLSVEEQVRRLNRVYAVLSGINGLIVRVRERDVLFNEACRLAVEVGGFSAAWVGVFEPVSTTVRVLAYAGGTPQHREQIATQRWLHGESWSGVIADVLGLKVPLVMNDLTSDPRDLREDDQAMQDTRSRAIFPVQVSDQPAVVLALYSRERNFFDEREIQLLTELAGDVGFALDYLDKQERLNYLAYFDALTGLPNRGLFLDRVAQSVRAAAARGQKLALYLIDLERFKNINDSLGQPAGDDLLRQMAAWLKSEMGDDSLLARVGADQFAAVLTDFRQEGEVARLLEDRIHAFASHPFQVGGAELRVAIKAGAALFPADGESADALFRNAEAALKEAKAGRERYLFYTREMTAMVASRLGMENQLRRALEKNEFVLHYQPKIELASRRIVGVEALIRWKDPATGKLVPPVQFIPVLEDTGLIVPVGEWALSQAAADYRYCAAAGLAAPRVAVNVSPLQLRQKGFVAAVQNSITRDGISAGIDLEITESLIMEDVADNIEKLKQLRDLGMSIAIDDFGTGYSSLAYLVRLPVETLKIDRSFVIAMPFDANTRTLVRTIITLAHSFNLKVVAEGVDSEEQAALLRQFGCDQMQGFLFSKAVPIEVNP